LARQFGLEAVPAANNPRTESGDALGAAQPA
jgi:hypothetical protein